MRDISTVHLNKRFQPLSLPSGVLSIAAIEVALRVVHRLTIVSYSSHDKEREQCLLLCIVLNLGVSKLSSYHCSNFIFCTPCIGFAFVNMLAITRMPLQSVFQESAALFETWLYHLANCIPVGHTQFTRPFPFPLSEVSLACETT